MISWFYALLLLILAAFMVIPFIPSVVEYFRRKDKGPRVVPDTTIIKEIPDLEERAVEEALPFLEQSRIGSRVKVAGDFVRIVGDVSVPDNTEVNVPLVVHGNLALGKSCKIHGSIKATKDLDIGAGSTIMGHCISGGDVVVGPSARVDGVVDAVGDIVLHRKAFIGAASADKSVRLESGSVVGKKLSAEELVVSEAPPVSLAPVPAGKEGVVIEEAPTETVALARARGGTGEGLFELDERFSKGEIDVQDYLQQRRNLISQLQSEPAKVKQREVVDLDKDELEVLKLLSEKKTVTEIALMLMKDPDQIEKRINKLKDQGFLNPDLSLTGTGVEVVFG